MNEVISVIILILALQVHHIINARQLDFKERHQIALACIEQTGVQQSVVKEAIAGNMPENNTKYREFLACSYKKQGFQSETGEILTENIKQFLQPLFPNSDLAKIDECGNYNETTHADTAYNALQCIMGYLKKLDVD